MPRRPAAHWLLPFLVIASLVVAPSPVLAHAELVRAIPADGETVTEPVTVVSGRYSQDLGGNSRLELKAADGSTIATGGIDPEDARRMVVRPPTPLTNGTFTVESTSISAEDGDVDRTTWTFTISVPASPNATPSSTAPAAPSADASDSPTPSSTSNPSSTASPAPGEQPAGTGDVLLPIVALIAIVGVGLGYVLNRSRRP